MELDWLIFPSPDTSYSSDKSNGEIIFIPKRQEIKIEIEIKIRKQTLYIYYVIQFTKHYYIYL